MKGIDFVSNNTKINKESVAKAVLAVSSATAITFGALFYDSHEKLEKKGEQLDKAQTRIVETEKNYESLEKRFTALEENNEKTIKKFTKEQKKMKKNLKKVKADKVELAEENKSLEVKLRRKQLREAKEREEKKRLAEQQSREKEAVVSSSKPVESEPKQSTKKSSQQSSTHSGKRMIVSSTGYSTYENGDKLSGRKWGGKTASGTTPHWGTIAVDPNVIPLGSKVYIPKLNMTFTAEDTGNKIIGNKIDVYFDSVDRANEWGVKTNLEVFVQ